MAPIINIAENDFERASQILNLAQVNYSVPTPEGKLGNLNDFVYVPSINLLVAKQTKFHGQNWFNSHKKL